MRPLNSSLNLWRLGLVLAFSALTAGAFADPVKLETENYRIPSADSGIELFIRNKHPAGVTAFDPGKILLYVHGAT